MANFKSCTLPSSQMAAIGDHIGTNKECHHQQDNTVLQGTGESDGILTGAGKTKWWTSTINKILRNENTSVMPCFQKTYTTDFLNKTRVKNNGIVPQLLCGRQPRKQLFRRIFSYGCRKIWYAGEWSRQAPMAKALLQLQPLLCAYCHLRRMR